MAANSKVQRSIYLTEDQARFVKVRAAEQGTNVSALIGTFIDHLMESKEKDPTKQMKNVHDILSKVAKQ